MLRFNSRVNLKTWAVPLAVSWNKTPSVATLQINLLCFGLQWLFINMPKVQEEAEALYGKDDPRAQFRVTKAYADERQKSRRNRKRKPKKAMANLYQLD